MSTGLHCRTIPSEPAFTTGSEKQVWQLLCETLSPEAVLMANFRISDQTKDHEADLIVLLPGVGVVLVEVKGGNLWRDALGWHQRSRGGEDHRCNPVEQAMLTKYAVRDYVEHDQRWSTSSRSRVVWAHAVVAPHSHFDEDFAAPECPRWLIHGRGDLADLASRLGDTARLWEPTARAPRTTTSLSSSRSSPVATSGGGT